MRKKYEISLKNRRLLLGEKTCIMGILNVTPDSFSDGGNFLEINAAVDHALRMAEDGADVIDIGGESTRPGSEPIAFDEELRRVLPVIEKIRQSNGVPISIDTYKSGIAKAAIDAGADIINDISGCRFDPEMARLAAKTNSPVVVMHIKGTPRIMQKNPIYKDVVREIKDYHLASIAILKRAGLPENRIIIDPGIGFGKTTEHNLIIMNRLEEFVTLNKPILMGVSRKSVIGNVTGCPVEERIFGTAAAVAANILKGAHIIRVHDVSQMKQVAKITDAIFNSVPGTTL